MLQAPSLLGANSHAGAQALEDADTVGGSCLDIYIVRNNLWASALGPQLMSIVARQHNQASLVPNHKQ